MSKYRYYNMTHIPTRQEKMKYLKQYCGAVVIAFVLLIPFAIYFANMKP